MNELKEQIRVVHEARLQVNSLRLALKVVREQWEAEHAALFDDANQATIELGAAEQQLRELTLKVYQETGSKAPAPGVGIRAVSRLVYEEPFAYKWAVEHQMALTLDKRAFEKIAKATPLDFVEEITEPQATIATDLTEAVKALGEEL